MATKVVRGQTMTFIATPADALGNTVSPASVKLYINYPHADGTSSTETVVMDQNTDGTWEADFDTSVSKPGALFVSVQAEGPSAAEDLKFSIVANSANLDAP